MSKLSSELISNVQLEELTTLTGHTERVWCVAWHPTLNILASASADNTVKLWAMEADYSSKSAHSEKCMANSKESESNGSQETCLCTNYTEHQNDNNGVTNAHLSFLPTSSFSAAEEPQSTVLKSEEEEEEEETQESTHCEAEESAGKVTETTTNYCATSQPNLFKWRCLCTLSGEHTRTIRHVSWSPSGNYLACASFDHTVSIWERVYEDVEMILTYEVEGILDGHESEVKCVAWGSESVLATCARDHNVWIWERVEQGEYECAGILAGHLQDVKYCLWEPTYDLETHHHHHEHRVLSCGYDDTIKVWTDSSIRQDDWHCVQTMKVHTGTVWAAAFQKILPQENTDSISSSPNNVNRMNSEEAASMSNETSEEITSHEHEEEEEEEEEEQQLLLSPTLPLLCSCSDDLTLRFWRKQVRDEKYVNVASYSGFCKRSIFAIDWSPHEPNLLAAVSGDNSVTLLCLHEDKLQCTNDDDDDNDNINNIDESNVNEEKLSSNNSINNDGTSLSEKTVDERTSSIHVAQLLHLDNAHNADVNSVSFANTIYSGATERKIKESCKEHAEKSKTNGNTELLMATGGDDNVVKLWRVVVRKKAYC